MSGWEYARAIAWRLGIFVGLTLLFPFFVVGLAKWTKCAGIGGACGAVALGAGLYLKPLMLFIFLGMLVRPSWRRAAGACLPKWYGLFVPAFFFLDAPFLVVWGAHWSVGFSLGILAVSPPYLALAGLLMAAFLAIKSPERVDEGAGFLRIAMIILSVLTGILLTFGNSLRFLPATSKWPVASVGPFAVLCVLAVLIGRELWLRRKSTPSPPSAPPRLPPRLEFGRRGGL
jgi:hypothetical protein